VGSHIDVDAQPGAGVVAGPGSGGPIYFAWCDANETTFVELTHCVFDEEVVAIELQHGEGAIPVLAVTFRNPKVGPFKTGRKWYAWIAWWNGTAVEPIFFGRVVGTQGNIGGGAVTYRLMSRRSNWLSLKRAAAAVCKVLPQYDPLFFDETERSNPESWLEGWAADFHIDRFGVWSVSDIITGEDGTVVLQDIDEASVEIEDAQPPLHTVNIVSDVAWKFSFTGVSIPVVAAVIDTYTGSSLISDWPKPGTSLDGGWIADQSFAVDLKKVGENRTT
jgi:hypothetical protein